MPQTTVAAAIINNNKILLTKRAIEPFKDKYCLPGGQIDQYESAEKAIIREVKEETGLTVKSLEYIGYRDEIVPERSIHNIVLFYICDVNGEINTNPNEVSDWYWEDISIAKTLDLAFDHQELIKMI